MSTRVAAPVEASAVQARTIRGVFMRGGTSKGVFFHDDDLPPAGPERDAVLLDVMGSPDARQIDGLGSLPIATNSKVAVVGLSPATGVDLDYAVGQVYADRPVVDWSGTCGNLTSAVGPFAIDEGLVRPVEPVTRLRLRNLSTGGLVDVSVPVSDGMAAVDGDFRIAGVPSPGARITTTYLAPGGSVFAGALPTGRTVDVVAAGDRDVAVSIVDVSHPYAFVAAADVGLDGGETADALNADGYLLARLVGIRDAAAELLASVNAPGTFTPSDSVPRLVLVAEPAGDDHDVRTLSLAMGRILPAIPVTAALCLAAAHGLGADVVHRVAGGSRPTGGLRIAHPSGVVEAQADVDARGTVRSAGLGRTARRLFSGTIHLRRPFTLPAATRVPAR